MNYLAHFHLAGNDSGLVVGALLGDYVKGPLDRQYSDEVLNGIRLHRRIDRFSDTHPVQQTVNAILPAGFRRYNGIIFDVLCDHFLSNNWPLYDQRKLAHYSASIYQILNTYEHLLPTKAKAFNTRMQKYNLLCAYKERITVEKTLNSIGNRLSKANPLTELNSELWTYCPQLEESFHSFYQQLLSYSAEQKSLLHDS
jgi:acyl carrier protein phosphodiesterase